MSKQQLEKKYGILIEEKDKVFYVYFKTTLLFLAPTLEAINKSMQYKISQGE